MVAKFGTLQQIPNTNSPNFALIDLLSRVSGNPHGTFFLHFQLRHPVVVPPSSMADRAEHGCSTTNVPQSNGIKTNSKFHHLLGSQYLKLCRLRAWQMHKQKTQHFWLPVAH